MTVVRNMQRGERIADIIDEGKVLTFQTGREHALVRLASGERAIVSGGAKGIMFEEGQVTRIFGHSHPYQLPPTGPSGYDVEALQLLGQKSSCLLEHGELTKFWRP